MKEHPRKDISVGEDPFLKMDNGLEKRGKGGTRMPEQKNSYKKPEKG